MVFTGAPHPPPHEAADAADALGRACSPTRTRSYLPAASAANQPLNVPVLLGEASGQRVRAGIACVGDS